MELANGIINKFFSLETYDNKYFVEDINSDKFWYNNYLFLLSNEIENNSKVLDVGCAQGKLGKKLYEKKCKLYGIEINEEAANEARQSGFYEEVFVYDLENESEIEFTKLEEILDKVDVIILSDILEHLVDPTRVLVKLSKLLQGNGMILIGVPNIANLDIILHLINDEFNYTELGILDNTHLKFFTKKSFVQWIQQINEVNEGFNFDCKYLGNTFYKSSYVEEIENKYPELFQIMLNAVNYNAFQNYFKLILLSPGEEANELKITLDEKNTDVVRLLGSALQGKNVETAHFKLSNNERLWLNDFIKEDKIQIADALTYINKLETENGKKYNQIEEALLYIGNLEAENGKNKNQIETALDYIAKLEEENRNKQNQIGELQVENWNKQNQIEKALLYINSLEDQVNRQNEKIDYFNNEKSTADTNITELKEKLIIIENKTNDLYEKIFNMENSFSWKITRRLRKR